MSASHILYQRNQRFSLFVKPHTSVSTPPPVIWWWLNCEYRIISVSDTGMCLLAQIHHHRMTVSRCFLTSSSEKTFLNEPLNNFRHFSFSSVTLWVGEGVSNFPIAFFPLCHWTGHYKMKSNSLRESENVDLSGKFIEIFS